MKHEITKQTGQELNTIAKRISEREDAIRQLKERVGDVASQAVAEAILQGQDLIKAKSLMPSGFFLDWLAANCPGVKQAMAYRYMAVAKNLSRVRNCGSIRQALALLAEDNEGDTEHEKKEPWPEYLEGLYRFGKVLRFVSDHPIDAWPSEGVDKLKKELQPVVAALWPEKFNEAAKS